jgi:hypothetical protein
MLKKTKKGGTIATQTVDKTQPSKRIAIIAFLILTLGIAMLPTSLIINNVIATEIDKGIEEQITVPDRQDEDYNEWKSNDYKGAIPIYTKFYIWNLTNPEATLSGKKPFFEELGPYRFREYSYKYNIKFDDDEDEVSFSQYTRYKFLPEDSSGSLNDNITNFNPAYLGVLHETGSENKLVQVMFPKVLQEVQLLFAEELDITLDELLTNEGVYSMLVDTIRDMLTDLVGGFLSDEAINLTATWLVDFLTSTLIPIEDLVAFMADAMPTANEIFLQEWANDYFPLIQVNLSILFNHLLTVIGDLVDFIIDLIFFWDVLHLFDVIKDALYDELMDMFIEFFTESPAAVAVKGLFQNLIRELGAEMVDEEGSATCEGVDIDGREPYNYPGPYADLNISTHSNGGANITQEQCEALWDPNDPYSLTGFDGLENPLWFDALEGDMETNDFLKDRYNLNDTQMDFILDWVDVSRNGWLKNLCEWQILEWNSGLLTTRTVEEWLFYANDTLVYNQDPERAMVGIFSNCQNSSEAEEAQVNSYTIKTGKGNINEVCQTVEFNGDDKIEIWAEDITLAGTDGAQFAPGVSWQDNLEVFVPDLMRIVDFEFDEFTSVYDIELYRFRMEENTFKAESDYFMTIDGCANMLPDLGTPVYLSKPHFLDGDDSLIHSIGGITEPDKDKHNTYIEVEPITGITMNARSRMQVNLKVQQTDLWYRNVSQAVMPILWLDSNGKITEEKAKEFKDLVYGALDLQRDLRLIVLAVGTALIFPGAQVTTNQTIKRRTVKSQKTLLVPKKKRKLLNSKIKNLKTEDPSKSKINSD